MNDQDQGKQEVSAKSFIPVLTRFIISRHCHTLALANKWGRGRMSLKETEGATRERSAWLVRGLTLGDPGLPGAESEWSSLTCQEENQRS